jgi:hypothetical protein
MLNRLRDLDKLLMEANISAALSRRFSLNNAGEIHAQKHRQTIDEFNEKKFFFMQKRKYQV